MDAKTHWDNVFSEGKDFTTLNEIFLDEVLLPKLDTSTPGEKKVLDIGCGTGDALEKFSVRGFVPHGVDLSPEAIRIARRRLDLAGAHLFTADIEGDDALSFDGVFDLILSKLVIAFIADKEKFLTKIKAKLTDNGVFLLITPVLYPGRTYTKKHTLGISVKAEDIERMLALVFPDVQVLHRDFLDDNAVCAYYFCRK